ncbi:MAG: protein-glutamate O-methyltransferase CheR [Deltaproteobacteria bacterium]|nr:protein-glutamate O-methyltransferase CheR [Deltaproteobacteria bacterium]
MTTGDNPRREAAPLETDRAFEALRNIVWARFGLDLSHYKRPCVQRRLEVRLRARACGNLAEYLERLSEDGDEIRAFLSTLTINVTEFFRNPGCFERIRALCLPQLFVEGGFRPGSERQLSRRAGPIRIWSVGCASGEESYSIAILAREYLDDRPEARPRNVEVFGSDIDAEMIARARMGFYEDERLGRLAAERRERWFDRSGDGWRVKRRTRVIVRHEVADVLRLVPEHRQDMIMCRNMLIYLTREQQDRLLKRFSEVLKPGGFLVLGRTELLSQSARSHFDTVCPRERIYQVRT